jgi:hypothetical protein
MVIKFGHTHNLADLWHLGNNIQLFLWVKTYVRLILLYTTFASGRMIATELLCHGDKRGASWCTSNKPWCGGGGVGCCRTCRFVKLPKIICKFRKSNSLFRPQMASALDHKSYLWCVHTHVRRRGWGTIFCNFRPLVHLHTHTHTHTHESMEAN